MHSDLLYMQAGANAMHMVNWGPMSDKELCNGLVSLYYQEGLHDDQVGALEKGNLPEWARRKRYKEHVYLA